MTNLLQGVDQRTLLAGQNRLELLLFFLNGQRRFAINVFKVQEVMRCPDLTRVPGAAPFVAGIATIRGKTITVIDLNKALASQPLDPKDSLLVVSEYNRGVQGFLVNGVDRIVNMNWKEILPPPHGVGTDSCLTAVTHVDGELVGLIDAERILSQIEQAAAAVSEDLSGSCAVNGEHMILVVDDSMVVRNRVKAAFEQISVGCILASNGQEALDLLRQWDAHQSDALARLFMVIADIEMPVMDGYTLTTEIKADPRLSHLYVLLHSSLSGDFNQAMVAKVGADHFVSKFDPNELLAAYRERIGALAEAEEAGV